MRGIKFTTKLVILAVLALLLPSFSSLPARAAGTYYLATNGLDTNNGTSLSTPFKTFSKALTVLRAGDTLEVRGGEYTENINVSLSSGAETSRITVKNYNGERPVVKGLVRLAMNYWTFNGINFTWNTGTYQDHMVKLVGGSGWILENCEVWGAYSYANILVASSPSNWTIRNCAIHDTYGGTGSTDHQNHNIYVNTELNAGPGLIEHNLFYNAPRGNNVKLDAPDVSTSMGTANVTVRYNTMYNTGKYPLLIGNGSKNNVITKNIMGQSNMTSASSVVRLYHLVGAGNSIADNVGFAASKFCDDYTSNSAGYVNCAAITSGGNLYPLDPQFDCVNSPVCFHPQNTAAQGYGRYAGQTGGGTGDTGGDTSKIASVGLTTSASPTSFSAGTVVTYTIKYSNTGTAKATNVRITNPIPNGTTYEEGSATNGGVLGGSTLIWQIGEVAVGASGTVAFKVRAN